MVGVVEHIHIVRVKRGTPEPVDSAALQPGRSIPGDHHDRQGIKRPVTLICGETIDHVARTLGVSVAPGSSRRNVTTRGIDLDSLPVGTPLAVGDARLAILGPCDPCTRMEEALGIGALALMEGRGGVIAKVVCAGVVRPGDAIEVIQEPTLQLHLLDWFHRNKRDLPWRRTKDAYAIWISEAMLQQTQVVTVISYWERFLARFPDVHSLAAAPLDDVLALWSGLGYYARARNLHRAAQAVVANHGGEFPRDLEALESLPGFGPYTAGAVASIALGMDAPLVDGNVARVLCRVNGWKLATIAAREKAWTLVTSLVPPGRAGDFNQSLMELGATVCTPVPRCDACPIQGECKAFARGEPGKYPKAEPKKARRKLSFVAVIARRGDAVLMVRRAESGLFGGLWQPPMAEGKEAVGALAKSLGAKVAAAPVGKVSQILTHRDVDVSVFVTSGRTTKTPPDSRWVAPDDLPTLGLSSLAVKTLKAGGVIVPIRK